MTLYSLMHLGKDRPFDQTPEERARESSRLKTIAVVVGLFASVITAIGGAVLLPDKVATSAAKGLQTKFDERYATLVLHKDLIDREQKSRDEMEQRLNIRLDALKEGLKETNATMRAMMPLLNESVGHGRFISGTLKGASPVDYEPLPRKAPTK